MTPAYTIRSCYVNCAEHLLNSRNVNILFENAPGHWTDEEWRDFFREIRAFGFNDFHIWIPPTLVVPGKARDRAADTLARLMKICREEGLTFHPMLCVNTIGGEWYFACPSLPSDRARILSFWRYYARALAGADYLEIFAGDPGGCNRNGCNHITYIELAAEIAALIKEESPKTTVYVSTWGTPFTGWGEDMRPTPDWDGTWAMLTDPNINNDPGIPCHIWNGKEERAGRAMRDLIDRLSLFPRDTVFTVNAGFNPDCEPWGGFSGLPWAKEIADRGFRVASWDYAASEGELICYPHWRVAKYKRKRMQERAAAPYSGAICYTMTPKLSQLMLYSAAQLMIDPDRDADELAAEFTEKVFGDGQIGKDMEAFEIVHGWGFEPRASLSKRQVKEMLTDLVSRLEAAKGHESALPIFPSAEDYRQELLWHARQFLVMVGENPDRARVREEYRRHLLSIYDDIPQAADDRTVLAADGYAKIGADLPEE